MPPSTQRLDDLNFAYQVRPVVIELAGRRQAVSSLDVQLLLGELGRLPRARHQAAENTAVDIVHALAAGYVIALEADGRRCVLRAIEGIRARRALPSGLARLREMLVRSTDPVV